MYSTYHARIQDGRMPVILFSAPATHLVHAGSRPREFTCRFNPSKQVFEYFLTAARKNSGKKGGHLTGLRQWIFENLYPEQRALIETLPKQK